MHTHQAFFHGVIILRQICAYRGNQAFKTSPAGSSVEKFQLIYYFLNLFTRQIKYHTHQPACAGHLLFGKLILGMCLPPWINDLLHNGKLLEIRRHIQRIAHMLLHTNRQCTYSAEHQPGVKGAHNSSEQLSFILRNLADILAAAYYLSLIHI